MTYRKAVCRGTVSTAALIFAAFLGSSAQAQGTTPPPSAPPSSGQVEKVTVTGSHIKKRRESTALPVDVITADDLEKDGAPTIVDIAKSLPVSNGVIGDTNQFDARAQGSEGVGSINLRGLGPTRTLILLNGRRLAINPFGLAGQGIVDTNIIPIAALDRVEVLKDGAAVTYGSDAIAGVVNFITKKNYDGAFVAGDWRFIQDADGDYSMRGAYGWSNDTVDFLLSAGFQHRSELDAVDRNFTQSQYLQNPEGGYTAAGNPGSFLYFNPGTALARDPQCATLGGTPGFSGTTPVCYEQYIDYDNLQEEENKLQLFSSLNVNLTNSDRFFVDALLATTKVPHWETSPSYAILSTPSALEQAFPPANTAPFFTNRFFVPGTNPGLVDFVAKNPSFAGMLNGAAFLAPAARPMLLGGNPMWGNGGQAAERSYEAIRVSGGFEGDISDRLSYQVDATYSRHFASRQGFDTNTDRFALALKGLGGPNCDRNPALPGPQGPDGVTNAVPGANGCMWFNPFSNAIQRNAISGETNPQYNALYANDPALVSWFFQELTTDQTADLFVFEAQMSADTGVHLFSEEPIMAAFGGQYRRDGFHSEYNDLANATVSPCVSSPDFLNDSCTGGQRNGPFVFLGVTTPADLGGDVYAFYTEWDIPVFDNFSIQAAARFEDYGGATGSTFDPKVSARWQVMPWLVLRGSAGSTFRAPPLVQLATGNITSLQSISGTFRAVDIGGNPLLEPESADTFNIGAIFDFGWLRTSIDYWGFDFENPIIAEPIGGIAAAMFPAAPAPSNCGVPAFAALQARFTFNGACSAANISRVQTFYVNGSPVTTKGVDALVDLKFGEALGGDIGAGGSVTYVSEYSVDAFSVAGVLVQPAFEASGFFNYQTTAYPIPKWKGSAYLDYTSDMHFLRVTMNYIDSYTDQRTAPFATGAYRDPLNNPVTVSAGKVIDEFVTFDLTYRLMLPSDIALMIAVDNIFDEDPSFARLDLSYDPLTGSALGRTFKLGIRKEF